MRDSNQWLLAAVLVGFLVWKRQEVADVVLTNTGLWKTAKNAEKYLPALHAAEVKYKIPPDLLARMAYQESHFRDDIVSGKVISSAGAVGIMQLVPRWHPSVNPLVVNAAIDYAGSYVRSLYDQFGSWKLAVAAYNAGPGNVVKAKGIPAFTETQNYVSQVFGDLITPGDSFSAVRYA